ncbi:MAG: TRAM domain-containing protein [Actinomycetota bacterium]
MAILGSETGEDFDIGQRVVVDIEKVAHGGHFIARHSGRVFFVRHALPGERVEIEITSTGKSFLRADAVSILSPSPDRVEPLCKFSGAGRCGGCDFQHISIARQRNLKADVVKEQFDRIAKMDIEVIVEEVGEPLHWRTRLSNATNEVGKIGFYAMRSHRVVPIDDCVIASSAIDFPSLAQRKWPSESRVDISSSSTGDRTIAIASNKRGSQARITEGKKSNFEEVSGHTLEVSESSFWQSHDLAPETLVAAVTPYFREGDRVLDLYGGVGLFTAAALDLIGPKGSVDLVESSASACANARRNFESYPNVKIHQIDVEKGLKKISGADVVVLDPPREGAGKEVLVTVAAYEPRSIVYVACDPAALARDSAYLFDLGYGLSHLRAFDLFPMTHHIECVATFEPSQKRESNVS